MSTIQAVHAREILDSRGLPTVEVDITLSDGVSSRAAVPSGKSTGSREACELRDGESSRFGGAGVLRAVHNVTDIIAPIIIGTDPTDQSAFDLRLIELDGTENKEKLGANAILGCSIAVARAVAKAQKVSLVEHLANLYGQGEMQFPVPMMNVINGGKHADSGISTQEFMIVPHGAQDISTAIRMGSETYQALGRLLKSQGYRVSVGDEGGFAPQLPSTIDALQVLLKAIEDAGYRPGADIAIALDFAANDFWHDGHYRFEGNEWSALDMAEYCIKIAREFPVVSVEDPLAEDDWSGWVALTKETNNVSLQTIGDDIFVTNVNIFSKGIERGVANGILIKPNQIGTVSETLSAIRMAETVQYRTVMSHRSGETDDSFISDLAVATHIGQMKSGAPARGERVAKYNQLMRLQEFMPQISMAKRLYNV